MTGVKGSGDVEVNVMLPVTLCSMMDLGHLALHVIAIGTLTTVMYLDEILEVIARPYAGTGGPNFLLVQHRCQLHVGRLCRQFLGDDGTNATD